MPSTSMVFARDYRSDAPAADVIREHRARAAMEAAERVEQRRAAQAEQRASDSAPAARIRAWEKLHELRLPADAAHPIVVVIAAETHLTVVEVREEQLARKTHRAAGM